jgi:hypothetical protein
MGEIQRDAIDMWVPVWPEQCQKCLRDNKIDHATAVMCPAGDDCIYYQCVACLNCTVAKSSAECRHSASGPHCLQETPPKTGVTGCVGRENCPFDGCRRETSMRINLAH